ncbi:hypothetical protein CTRI78_v005880 [Colletotrichum trifolii]|uniref:Uncharacterized protein n=1 Tax=Colletotrichum trifolii TaxID=5466 RepID=A0A4R8RDP0_COLTR|nr:hypothetical protein CTRI78_v005880 [Colletotrichum trifolii]
MTGVLTQETSNGNNQSQPSSSPMDDEFNEVHFLGGFDCSHLQESHDWDLISGEEKEPSATDVTVHRSWSDPSHTRSESTVRNTAESTVHEKSRASVCNRRKLAYEQRPAPE